MGLYVQSDTKFRVTVNIYRYLPQLVNFAFLHIFFVIRLDFWLALHDCHCRVFSLCVLSCHCFHYECGVVCYFTSHRKCTHIHRDIHTRNCVEPFIQNDLQIADLWNNRKWIRWRTILQRHKGVRWTEEGGENEYENLAGRVYAKVWTPDKLKINL